VDSIKRIDFGKIVHEGDSVLVGDDVDLVNVFHIDRVARCDLHVQLVFVLDGKWEELSAVELTGSCSGAGLADHREFEVGVDSGTILLCSAIGAVSTVPAPRVAQATRKIALDHRVALIADALGVNRGFVAYPPYGDGGYTFSVQYVESTLTIKLTF
jgi:hypothetical protein